MDDGLLRLGMHVVLAGLPLLAISAHVFGLVAMDVTAGVVVLPLAVFASLRAWFDPLPVERVVTRGACWGVAATAVYDAVRLTTVHVFGWWGDFIPTMGTWLVDTGPDDLVTGAVVGYLWRYLGDGGGIGVVFFVLAAATGLRRHGSRTTVAAAVLFAVTPVWAGLIITVAAAPHGEALMFPLTPATLLLSLLGHLVFGVVAGIGCARADDLDDLWPWPPLVEGPALSRPPHPPHPGARTASRPSRG